MQFTLFTTVAIAALATAMPAAQVSQAEGEVLISLPPGCTKEDLAST